MPARFTCRLVVTKHENGKVSVGYAPLVDLDNERQPLILRGPTIVIPPEGEMTEDEYKFWLDELTALKRYTTPPLERFDTSAPLVEAIRTYEELIPRGSIRAELEWLDHGEQQLLCVILENTSDLIIPRVSLKTVCKADLPTEWKIGEADGQLTGSTEEMFSPVLDIAVLGREEVKLPEARLKKLRRLDQSLSSRGKEFYAGKPKAWVLDSDFLPTIKNRAAFMSPEKHWISVMTDGYEFGRIPGDQIATFLNSEPEPK